MEDQNKTKKQLINELMELRQRTAELEKLETEHRKAEKSLKESEERYRGLYDEAPVGYHEYDKEGRITDVNRTDLEMLGYTREEMVGEFIWKFHVEKEIAYQQILAKLSGTLPPGRSLERTYRRKDGTTFPALFEDRLIRDERGQIKGIRCAIQDITERKQMEEVLEKTRNELEQRVIERTSQLAQKIKEGKQAEEVLRQSEERYRILVEESFDGIFVQKGDKVIFANQRLYEILGYDKGQLEGLNHWLIYHPDYQVLTRERAQARMRGVEVPSQYEVKLQRKDGSSFDGEINARKIMFGNDPGIQVWVRDITERKRAEEALRQSEERYRIIAAHVGDIVWQLNINLQFVYVSPSVERVLGYSVGETLKMRVTEILDQDGLAQMKQYIQTRLHSEEPARPNEYKMRHKDGHWVDMEIVSSPVYDSQGRPVGFAGVTRDVSERKRAEEVLRESEERYRSFFDNSIDAVLLTAPDGGILTANAEACRIFGYTEEELRQIGRSGIIDASDPRLSEALEERKRTGRFKGELTLIRKDRTKFPGEISTGVFKDKDGAIRTSMIIRDVTERKQAEKALRGSEEKYRSILENIEEGYFEVDIAGNFTFFNDSLCRLLGYSRNEMMGMNDRQYTDEINAKKLFQAFNQVYRTGKPTQGFDWEIIRKDGKKRYIETSVSLIKDSSDQPIGFRGVVRDITEHKQMEDALRESEKQYRQVVESAAEIIYSIDVNGNFTYGNPAGLKVTGYTLEELKRFNYKDLVVPEYLDGLTKIYANQFREKRATTYVEFPFSKKSGEVVWFGQNTSLVMEEEKVVGFYFIARDITERKQAEIALQKSEEKFKELFNTAPVGYFEYDNQGRIANVNQTELEMLGYTSDEMIGQPVWKFIVEEETARQQILAKLAGTMPPFRGFEQTYRRKDGTSFPTLIEDRLLRDSEGKIVGIRSTIQDITDRKHAEEALRQAEENFRRSLENSPLGVHIVTKEGETVYANRAILDIYGYDSIEELRTTPVKKRYTPESYAEFKIRKEKRQRGENVPSEYEIGIVRKNGEIRHLRVFRKEVLWNGERQFQTVYQDITERKRAEQEMATLQEQLRQSQKMEAIGLLAGGIAHDFNNLLTVIKGNSELSLIDLEERDPLRENIEEIKEAANKAEQLTRQLLAFSRKQILEMKVLDLNKVIQRLDKMLGRVIGEDIELVTFLPDFIWKVKADTGQIEQVIINLAVNARDAMPDGGKLTIETANVELDEEYAHKHVAVKPGRYVMLSMSDSGVGMTPEVRERIFEPFFSTKEKGKGTGLGLSTVYGIVKQSGGNIWVYSESGQGTTFKIYLPQVDEPLEKMKDEVIREVLQGNETILIVEDEEVVRKLAVRVLKKQGYKVLEAPDGGKAFILCEGFKEPIHLILTDVVMPGMSGSKLVERLKEIHPEMKALYMSGYTDNAILHHGILDPGINFIQKPFNVDGLARKVRDVLDKGSDSSA